MKFIIPLATVAAGLLAAGAAGANDRYSTPPPLYVSPDLSAPWVMQLRRAPDGYEQRAVRNLPAGYAVEVAPERVIRRERQPIFVEREMRQREYVERQAAVAREGYPRGSFREAAAETRQYRAAQPDLRQGVYGERAPGPLPRADGVQTAALAGGAAREINAPRMDPKFLPQEVAYDGPHKAGTVVIDTRQKFLYLVGEGGKARRYGVGVGKEGFLWRGTENITRKGEWPDWRPPAEMIAREKKKGRILPAHMPGGPENPLGARALYLGSTLYRIHGTNAPWTIGGNVSSGCIRMRNEDVTDLYERVKVGTRVVVL